MTTVMDDKDLYLTQFSQFEKGLHDAGPPWLAKIRQAAIDRFAALGLPTLEDEEWRFTNLAGLKQVPFALADQAGQCQLQHGELPPGVILCSLADALRRHPELVERVFGRFAEYEEQPFTALNTAFAQTGAFLYLPRNAVVAQPILLSLNAAVGGKQPHVWHPRVLIVAEANSQARLVERYEARDGVYFTNAVTEVVLGENAVIDYYKVQQESPDAFHIHTLQVQQSRSSNFAAHTFNLGGKLVRNDINANLAGEGCECTLNGLSLAAGTQLVDNHTRIEHAQPHCTSHELYKSILDGKAHGVFNGKIHVHLDAQKTDAKQTNQTLLLSDDAVINTKPQLEIYADDVKCTHGATVGQLDTESLFYLRSRGLSRDAARSLLIYAFANDLIGRIQVDALRQELEKHLLQSQHLPQAEPDEDLS